MNSSSTPTTTSPAETDRSPGILLAIIGMVHTLPTLPGLDEWVGIGWKPIAYYQKFPFQYLNPLVFVLMMTIVVLKHSFYQTYRHKNGIIPHLGLAADILFVLMAYAVAWTYLMEIESVCIIDRITGERQALIAKALAAEKDFALSMGLPIPTSVDDPNCQAILASGFCDRGRRRPRISRLQH